MSRSSGIATITRKRQFTIPAVVARKLGLRPGHKLVLRIGRKGRIVGTPLATVVERRAGSMAVRPRKEASEG